jgi:hypothetical protein
LVAIDGLLGHATPTYVHTWPDFDEPERDVDGFCFFVLKVRVCAKLFFPLLEHFQYMNNEVSKSNIYHFLHFIFSLL